MSKAGTVDLIIESMGIICTLPIACTDHVFILSLLSFEWYASLFAVRIRDDVLMQRALWWPLF